MRLAGGAALPNHRFIRLGFVLEWKSVAPPDSVLETFENLERRLDAVAAAHGKLALTVPMACFVARRQDAAGEPYHHFRTSCS